MQLWLLQYNSAASGVTRLASGTRSLFVAVAAEGPTKEAIIEVRYTDCKAVILTHSARLYSLDACSTAQNVASGSKLREA